MDTDRVTPAPMVLPADHPGVSDLAYRRRRAAIAAVGEAHRPGDPIPDVDYAPRRMRCGPPCRASWASSTRPSPSPPTGRAPGASTCPPSRCRSWPSVSDRLTDLTGWAIEPVPGLVPTRTFYGALAERRFCSTQYVRHHSVPFYTPEPDIVHELVGHANALAHPRFAALYELAGRAARSSGSDATLEAFSRVFWFSLEFGVLWEGDELRTYGAGLLSSYGEIQCFRDAEVRDLDLVAMADHGLRHHPVPAGPVRGPVLRPRRGRAVGVLRRLGRRRPRPPPVGVSRAPEGEGWDDSGRCARRG